MEKRKKKYEHTEEEERDGTKKWKEKKGNESLQKQSH